MTANHEEDPERGYFNWWSGRYPPSAVRTLDLYLAWRDGEKFPPLESFPNLDYLMVPVMILDDKLVAQIRRLPTLRGLRVFMGQNDQPNPGIFSIEQLEGLDLAGNELTSLPDLFGGLPRLRSVAIDHNDLTEIPPSLAKLPTLHQLTMSGNQFTEVPMIEAPLTELELAWNPLAVLDGERLPRTLEVLIATCKNQSIVSLARLGALRKLAVLVGKGYELPDLTRLSRLVEIEVAGFYGGAVLGEPMLDRLPANLESIGGVGSHCMGLTRVPPQIARFTKLRQLDVTFEKVTEIAADIRKLPLEVFKASSTLLADTPTYSYLPGTLKTIELSAVGMTRVPERFRELEKLETLRLVNNPLVERPEWLARVRNVHYT